MAKSHHPFHPFRGVRAYDRLGRREEADVGEAREVMDRIH